MRFMALAAASSAVASATVSSAQPAPFPLPRAFAGYAQPAITPGLCKVISAGETQCVIPAMSAGRYVIEAAGTSTAAGAAPQQALEIVVGESSCGLGRNTKSWSGGRRTFRLSCEVRVVADAPITVRALYADAQATKDPKGPALVVRALPWDGVLSSRIFAPKQ
ncbi:MAG: hypothetical protein H0X27_05465 [Caulobacteraceae bacterium]|nr:hypothetical protein [Caulobacteraceae bacterium]